uniref:EGF-like domain-containing protein n=1 Tax=Heterorhabditis bacteriophora TaxID=37862 RepID=A0A1I7X0I7_HETBA
MKTAGVQMGTDGQDMFAKVKHNIDECSLQIHECDYKCENTIGSYICSCPEGYELTNDVQCFVKFIKYQVRIYQQQQIFFPFILLY